MSKKKKSQTSIKELKAAQETTSSKSYEGDRLDDLLLKLGESIETAKASKGELPEKIWIKQQFAVGVNDVTRVLERMPQGNSSGLPNEEPINSAMRRAPLVPLQAVLVAADCNPKWLTKHVPSMASSRQVPVISVKDNKRGSLRLGDLLKVKTAMAIGIKTRGTIINKTIEEILSTDG